MIGLWRESDRLALVSDTLYTLDPQTGIKGASARAAQGLQPRHGPGHREPAQAGGDGTGHVWPGHADPVTGDVRAQLERAADAG